MPAGLEPSAATPESFGTIATMPSTACSRSRLTASRTELRVSELMLAMLTK